MAVTDKLYENIGIKSGFNKTYILKTNGLSTDSTSNIDQNGEVITANSMMERVENIESINILTMYDNEFTNPMNGRKYKIEDVVRLLVEYLVPPSAMRDRIHLDPDFETPAFG